VFPAWANYLLPVLVLGVVGGGLYVPALWVFGASAETLNTGYRPEQPVAYSHRLHAGELGMDCEYCHTTVDDSSFAAIPSTDICMNCHNPDDNLGVRNESSKLEPVHESAETGEAIQWQKVHDLPDYVYFNHSAHVNRGVSCISCHGRVDKMGEDGVYQTENLSMGWCLDCHRSPEEHLRPKDEVTHFAWDPRDHPAARDGDTEQQAQLRVGRELKVDYDVHDQAYMTACSTCHR
jgi:hypothetical protein